MELSACLGEVTTSAAPEVSRLTAEMIAGSDKLTKALILIPFADKRRGRGPNREELSFMGAVSMCQSFSNRPQIVFALVLYSPKMSI